eukprot:3298890-Rhodomonas_salina.2
MVPPQGLSTRSGEARSCYSLQSGKQRRAGLQLLEDLCVSLSQRKRLVRCLVTDRCSHQETQPLSFLTKLTDHLIQTRLMVRVRFNADDTHTSLSL